MIIEFEPDPLVIKVPTDSIHCRKVGQLIAALIEAFHVRSGRFEVNVPIELEVYLVKGETEATLQQRLSGLVEKFSS